MARPERTFPHRKSRSTFASTLKLARWQLRETWRLLLVIGLGLLAAVVLVCALPLYSQIAMSAGLRDVVNSTSGGSFVTVHSIALLISPSSINNVGHQIDHELVDKLGPYVNAPGQFSVQDEGLPLSDFNGKQIIPTNDQITLIGASIKQAASHLKLIEGRLPQVLSNTIEIAITPQAAQALRATVGSVFYISIYYNNDLDNRMQQNLKLSVVGIFTPTLTDDAFWHGETFQSVQLGNLGPPTLYRVLISNETFIGLLGQLQKNYAALGLTAEKQPSFFWYYHIDSSYMDVNKLDDMINGMNDVLVDIANKPVDPPYVENTSSTGPLNLLDLYNSRISVVRIPLISLTLLVLGMVLFFVSMMTSILVDRQSPAISILQSRGAPQRHIFGSLVIQSIGLGLIVLIVGPLLAITLVHFLTQSTLTPVDQGAFNIITNGPMQVALGLLWPAAATVLVAVIAMIIAVRRALRFDVLALRREAARSTHRPFWQRMYLDLVAAVIALTCYGFALYVASPGVFNAQLRVLVLSPLTLIGAVFLLLACILLFLRFIPWLLQFGAWLAARGLSAAPMLALAQVSRSPRQSMRMTLLLAVSTAFAIFTLIFTATQSQHIFDVAAYQTGADFSGAIPGTLVPSLPPLANEQAAYRHFPAVTSATVGYTSSVRAAQNGLDISLELRAVDAGTFAQTTIWTEQESSQSLPSLMTQLVAQRNAVNTRDAVPAIIDTAAWESLHLQPGTVFTINDLNTGSGLNGPLNMIAVAEVHHIPTVYDSTESTGTGDYVASGGILIDYTSYAALIQREFHGNAYLTPNYVWLRTNDDPLALAKLRNALNQGDMQLNPLYDRRALISRLQNDPLNLALVGILVLGATTALLLALVGNFLASWLNARSRLTNFAVLRALGTAPPQIASVLTWEQGIIYTIAIALGTLFGAILSAAALTALIFTSVPATGVTSTTTKGDFLIEQSIPSVHIVVPISLLIVIAVLIAICIVALGIMVRIVSQPSISQTLRLNED